MIRDGNGKTHNICTLNTQIHKITVTITYAHMRKCSSPKIIFTGRFPRKARFAVPPKMLIIQKMYAKRFLLCKNQERR